MINTVSKHKGLSSNMLNLFFKMNLQSFLIFIFLFVAFFPYIKFLPFEIGSDLQPYALIFSILLFVFVDKTLPKEMLFLLFIALEGTLVFFSSNIGLNEIRSFSSYWSLFLIAFATYSILKKYKHNVKQTVQLLIVLYFLIGAIQFLFDKSFLTFLTHDWRTTDSRGVTNLMVEPTYYAIFCLLGCFIAYELKLKKRYIFLLIFQIFIFSKSSMLIVLLLLFLALKLLFLRCGFKEILVVFIFAIFVSLLLTFYGYEHMFANLRITEIIISFITSPFDLLMLDKSINERLVHLFFSIDGWVTNFFIFPNGFSMFGKHLTESLPNYSEYFIVNNYGNKGMRIMSGYGAALYELGIGGILLIWYVWHLQTMLTYPLYQKIFFLIFMFTAVPLAIPLVGIYIGLIQYNSIFRKT